MSAWLSQLEPWHWLTLGLVLLAAEALGAAGFLLGTAIAAFTLAILNAMFDMSWQTQLVVFSVSAVVYSIAYWKYFKAFNKQSDHEEINQRAASLIGREFILQHDFCKGEGRVQIGDTFWKTKCDFDLKQGDKVTVTGASAMTITIAPKTND